MFSIKIQMKKNKHSDGKKKQALLVHVSVTSTRSRVEKPLHKH